MQSVSPVWTDEQVEVEQVIALDQPEYIPLIVLPCLYENGLRGVSTRFRPTAEERQALLDGADLVVTELTAGGFAPIHVQIVPQNTMPDWSR